MSKPIRNTSYENPARALEKDPLSFLENQKEEEENENLLSVVRPGTSHGLDYVDRGELARRAGISVEPLSALEFAVKETVANALGKDDATRIRAEIDATEDLKFYPLKVSDNGSKKVSRQDVESILNFDRPASSNRALNTTAPGTLGSAMKSMNGLAYRLAVDWHLEPPPFTITSGGKQFTCRIWPDLLKEKIEHEVVERDLAEDDGYTTAEFLFPFVVDGGDVTLNRIKRFLDAVGLLNGQQREIIWRVFASEGRSAPPQPSAKLSRRETLALSYPVKPGAALCLEFVRARPNLPLYKFFENWKWLKGRKKVAVQILQKAADFLIQDSELEKLQKLRAVRSDTAISDIPPELWTYIFAAMRALSKSVKKRSIQDFIHPVGWEAFMRKAEEQGWSLRYDAEKVPVVRCPLRCTDKTEGKCDSPDHVEFPAMIEGAFFDRPQDGEGLQVVEGFNNMPCTAGVFDRLDEDREYSVLAHLARAGVRENSPVTVVVHMKSPVQSWRDTGKTRLDFPEMQAPLEKLLKKLVPIPKSPREYRPPPPPKATAWIPRGDFYNRDYRKRLRCFASEILAIDRQSSFHVRPRMRGWGYRCEQLGKIDGKGEFRPLARAINDCRKLDFLPMDIISPDPDESRHFRGIHRATDPKVALEQLRVSMGETLEALPTFITDFYEGEKYYLMMAVEKGEVLILFAPICEEYGFIPNVATKGWSNLEILYNIAKQCLWATAHGLIPVLLCFYDLDPKGEEIPELFRQHLRDMTPTTGFDPTEQNLKIDRFGLTEEQITDNKLSWVNNLETSSGKEAKRTKKVINYIKKHGTRKCEMESLYRDDKTTRAAEQICRKAIEEYLGENAKERFRRKVEASKVKLEALYSSPFWKQMDDGITAIEKSCPAEVTSSAPQEKEKEEETEVVVDNKFYGVCPNCSALFDYSTLDIGKLKRCRECGVSMRLKGTENASAGC